MPFRKGPFEVIAKKRSSFTLRNLVTNEIHDELIFNLSKYNHIPEFQDPRNAAMKDKQFNDIEFVVSH